MKGKSREKHGKDVKRNRSGEEKKGKEGERQIN